MLRCRVDGRKRRLLKTVLIWKRIRVDVALMVLWRLPSIEDGIYRRVGLELSFVKCRFKTTLRMVEINHYKGSKRPLRGVSICAVKMTPLEVSFWHLQGLQTSDLYYCLFLTIWGLAWREFVCLIPCFPHFFYNFVNVLLNLFLLFFSSEKSLVYFLHDLWDETFLPFQFPKQIIRVAYFSYMSRLPFGMSFKWS